jgi:Anti-sigma factor NepR
MQRNAKPDAFQLIGEKLRGYYCEDTKQVMPDQFLELLKSLQLTDETKVVVDQ